MKHGDGNIKTSHQSTMRFQIMTFGIILSNHNNNYKLNKTKLSYSTLDAVL